MAIEKHSDRDEYDNIRPTQQPILAEELQRNRYNLRNQHPSGYGLRKRQAAKYVNRNFVRQDQVEVGLHITVKKAISKFLKKASVEMYHEIRQLDNYDNFEPFEPFECIPIRKGMLSLEALISAHQTQKKVNPKRAVWLLKNIVTATNMIT